MPVGPHRAPLPSQSPAARRGAVLAPSDLEPVAGPAAVRVGGRVHSASAGTLLVGDAFATVEVELAPGAGAADPGDLVVVVGLLRAARLVDALVVERHRPARPVDAHGETRRLVHGDVGPMLAARAAAVRAVRDFFHSERFLEVDTPVVVPSPGLDLHLSALTVGGGDAPAYLGTSPEYQMKRLLAGGVPRCFQITHCFRGGERGDRHEPEFAMLEWYRTFASVDDVIDDTERLVRTIAQELSGATALDVAGTRVDLLAPFDRLAVADAFALHAGTTSDEALALAASDEERFFRLLVERVEPALARAPRPVFLVDWPAPMASLARLSPRDPRVAERFELYVAGVELCNGFGELVDPVEQRQRFERDRAERSRRGLPAYPIDERFLAALEEGIPPSAGNALGLDRLVATCLGAPRIGDVMPFPAAWL